MRLKDQSDEQIKMVSEVERSAKLLEYYVKNQIWRMKASK
jgi:hypothetical protein